MLWDAGCSKVSHCCSWISLTLSHFSPAGASRCAPGFYSPKGSLEPCQQCPAGRTTYDDHDLQATITDCLVRPGFGVTNSSAAGLAAFAVNTAILTAQMQASLVVLECPVGYYGVGGAVDSTCTQCPCGSTTTVTGATSEGACTGKHSLADRVPSHGGNYLGVLQASAAHIRSRHARLHWCLQYGKYSHM
jgi:hypothetical protein